MKGAGMKPARVHDAGQVSFQCRPIVEAVSPSQYSVELHAVMSGRSHFANNQLLPVEGTLETFSCPEVLLRCSTEHIGVRHFGRHTIAPEPASFQVVALCAVLCRIQRNVMVCQKSVDISMATVLRPSSDPRLSLGRLQIQQHGRRQGLARHAENMPHPLPHFTSQQIIP